MGSQRKLSTGWMAIPLVLTLFLTGCADSNYDPTKDWSNDKLYNGAKDEMAAGAYDKAIGMYEKLEGRAAGTRCAVRRRRGEVRRPCGLIRGAGNEKGGGSPRRPVFFRRPAVSPPVPAPSRRRRRRSGFPGRIPVLGVLLRGVPPGPAQRDVQHPVQQPGAPGDTGEAEQATFRGSAVHSAFKPAFFTTSRYFS